MIQLNYAPAAHKRGPGPIPIVGAMAGLFVLFIIAAGGVNQVTAAILIVAVGAGLAVLQPTVAIVFTFIYVTLMGDIRRYVVVQAGHTSNDPLLLVGPTLAVVCIVMGIVRNRFVVKTQASRLIGLFMGLMVLEMFNPLQGGITVGLAGGLFFMVPLCWFWVGQAWGSSEFLEKLLYRVFVPLAVLGSLLGIVQNLFGYLHFEALWFRITTESAARPDLRPFAFFCSWAEFAFYTAAALVVALTPLVRRRLRVSVLFAPLFGVALVLESVREAIAGVVIAMCLLWAVQARSAATIGSRLLIGLVAAAITLGIGLSMLKEADVSKEVGENLNHTADGFLDVENSSAPGHVLLAQQGVLFGLTNPIGMGLGAPTMAGGKSGGFSSEIDFSDVAIACGIGGMLLYLYLLFVIFRSAFVEWRDRRCVVALYLLGILASQPGHILGGAHYATTILIWFTIGTFDRIMALNMSARTLPTIRRVGQPTGRSRFATGAT